MPKQTEEGRRQNDWWWLPSGTDPKAILNQAKRSGRARKTEGGSLDLPEREFSRLTALGIKQEQLVVGGVLTALDIVAHRRKGRKRQRLSARVALRLAREHEALARRVARVFGDFRPDVLETPVSPAVLRSAAKIYRIVSKAPFLVSGGILESVNAPVRFALWVALETETLEDPPLAEVASLIRFNLEIFDEEGRAALWTESRLRKEFKQFMRARGKALLAALAVAQS